MFDDALLQRYMNTFYGYGNYSGMWWFIGIEEGGGKTPAEIADRIATWDRRGARELDDLVEYHRAIGVFDYFTAAPVIQRTWGRLIHLLLAAADTAPVTRETVRAYQRDQLGRAAGHTCLLELQPLPAPRSAGEWPYAGQTGLAYLQNRRTYHAYLGQRRAQHIAARVAQYRPQAVVFYSGDPAYRPLWNLIAGTPFDRHATAWGEFLIGTNKQTAFAIAKHPGSRRPPLNDEYFHAVGRAVARQMPRGQ